MISLKNWDNGYAPSQCRIWVCRGIYWIVPIYPLLPSQAPQKECRRHIDNKTLNDKNNSNNQNNVIYKICCNDCDATYIGQTKRQLGTRVKEYKNNIRLDPSKHSVVTEHIIKENHSFDWDNTRILDIEKNFYKRLISETIHIKEQKNSINLNKDTELLDCAYFDILKELSVGSAS